MRLGKGNFFHFPKVRQQILQIFFLAAILPILILGIFSTIHVRNEMKGYYESQIKADGLRVNSILFDVTTSMYTTTENIVKSKKSMSLFSSEEPVASNDGFFSDVNHAIQTLHKNTAAVSSVHIYTDNPNIPSTECISSGIDYANEDWYPLIGQHWSTWSCLDRTDRFHNKVYELVLIRRIGVIRNHYSAYLVLTLDGNYIKNRLEQNDYEITACVDDLPGFYSSDDSFANQPMCFPEDFNGSFYHYTGPFMINNTNTLSNIISFRPYKTENIFYIRISDYSAFRRLNNLTRLYIFIIALATLAPAALILFFSSYFSKRITTLKTAMHQASIGDYNIIENFSGDDELRDTFTDLRTIVEELPKKEARFYEAKINEQKLINRQQQMEFEMLASQINPHFLYNTLETIRMQALASGNRDVATSIKLLGKSMHYVLENTGTSFTTLTKELDYVKTYLTIQNLRFGDRVNATFHIAENINTDDYQILPLLLQPIVENAIVHGLENVEENGIIILSVVSDDSQLIITVSDNGPGMDEDTLKNLNFHINNHDPNDARSIGLYNINQRIHLLYGNEYGLTIGSSPGVGTTVTLTLPDTFEEQL